MINGSFAIIVINDKILFLKRKDNGLWDLPGGGFETSEIDYKSICSREIKEETGLEIAPKQLRLCGILGQRLKKEIAEKHGGIEKGLVFLHCSIIYTDPSNKPCVSVGDEHDDYRMFTYEEIIIEHKDFSSGPLSLFFTYLAFQQTNKVQEGMLRERQTWQGKEY